MSERRDSLTPADYERHLREPDRKVREDVEREWADKYAKLQRLLESKRTWAVTLDNNIRHVNHEKKALEQRCRLAEEKLHIVINWVNAALNDGSDDEQDDQLNALPPPRETFDDFGPDAMGDKLATLSLNASKMRRDGSVRNLQTAFHSFVGSLGRPPRGNMIRDEPVPALASVDGDHF